METWQIEKAEVAQIHSLLDGEYLTDEGMMVVKTWGVHTTMNACQYCYVVEVRMKHEPEDEWWSMNLWVTAQDVLNTKDYLLKVILQKWRKYHDITNDVIVDVNNRESWRIAQNTCHWCHGRILEDEENVAVGLSNFHADCWQEVPTWEGDEE